MFPLKLFLFGPPRLEWDGKLVDISLRKALALLAYLAATKQSHSRDALAALFWPDDDQGKARGNLRRALSRINAALGKGQLETDRERAGLNPKADLWIDVDHFQRHLAECRTHDHSSNEVCTDCIPLLTDAISSYTDDFLAGFTLPDCPDFDEWQFFQGESLRQALASALERLVHGLSTQSDYESAIPYARRWLALDPLHEPAHRQLMELYAQSGLQAAALRQYQECVRILDEELGISPSEETTALYEAIKTKRFPPLVGAKEPFDVAQDRRGSRGGGEIVQHSPLSRDPSAPQHNLPPQPTPFIGREIELAALDDLIANPEVRLITIIGPGGMGKTRMALASAERQLEIGRFPNGVYFVSLAPLSSVDHIIPTITEALNFPLDTGDQQSRTPKQQILDYLRQKQMLLVMDNFEHLLDGVDLIADVLQTAPQVQILATSRERLHLHEEQVYSIRGLEFPDAEMAKGVADYDASKLFLQSARRVVSDFELEADDLTDLTRICRLVEGLPLGLELAASWVDMLSLADIAAEIQQSLDFLETEVRNIPERHRSMRAVFDTSWQRLNENEQAVFAQLSIFRGGFTRQAAQEVTGASLRLLATLANKSLIRYSQRRERYEIHELLRQYGVEKLANRTSEVSKTSEIVTRDRHSAYYCAALHQCETDLKGARQQEALAEIEADIENTRAAWGWAVNQGNIEQLRQAMNTLGYFYEWRGRYQEGEVLFRLATEQLNTTGAGNDQRTLAEILAWQAVFSRTLGDTELAEQLLQQSLSLLDDPQLAEQDIRPEKAFALFQMGIIARGSDLEEARRLVKESLSLFRALGDRWGMAYYALDLLGDIAVDLGDYDEARQCFEESLAIGQSLGDQRIIAASLEGLGFTAYAQGQLEKAETLRREVIVICWKIGYRVGLAYGLYDLGVTLLWLGKFAEAYSLMEESLAIRDDLGHRIALAFGITSLGFTELHRGRYKDAHIQGQRGLVLAQEVDLQRGIGLSCCLLGEVALAEEVYDEAQRLLQESVTICEAVGQQRQLGWSLADLGHAVYRLGQPNQARRHLYEALRTAVEIRAFLPLITALPVITLLLADQTQKKRAVELYALALRYPVVANSRWFEDVAGQHIKAIAATLPPNEVEAAQARGQELDLWETAAELLGQLTEQGWGELSG